MVHGQNECDIPTQLPVHEDTQFEALLKVGLMFDIVYIVRSVKSVINGVNAKPV